MASPILPQRTYRLSQIPDETSAEEIRQIFPSNVRGTIQQLSLARGLDSAAPNSQVSTVTFQNEPPFLASLPYKFGSLLSALVSDVNEKFSNIWIDAHFHGFTTMNNPVDESEAVDIIALTGLGGKAFASWQCYDGSMWLRDHVPMDVSNSRVSIYGYSSEIANSDSIVTLAEITEAFILDLLSYRALGSFGHRDMARPIILIGHSTGGIIVKDVWCRCAESASPLRADIYRSISGLVFFGTPHNGMVVTNVLQGLAGQASENLVRDIAPGSTYIRALKERFARATTSLRIISCYELRQTPQSEFHPDGAIVRSGKSAMNAPESTACLYWANEVRIPINENHSMIAKLAKRDGSHYRAVVNNLSQLVIASRLGITKRLPYDNSVNDAFQTSEAKHSTQSLISVAVHEKITSDEFRSERPATSQIIEAKYARKEPTPFAPPPGFESKLTIFDRQVRVYIYGIWDMFHYGHARVLKFAKQAFPNSYLIVGVIGDEDIQKLNGLAVMATTERAEVVRVCKYVDEVVENCPPLLISEFVAQLRIDYFGCSEELLSRINSDPSNSLDLQGKGFALPRTPDIGSKDILARIIHNRDLFMEKQSKNIMK